MGIFGWDYPPGCSSTPFDEHEGPCGVCGGFDIDPKRATEAQPSCICPECPECSEVGFPDCYEGHGLTRTAAQQAQHAAQAARWKQEQEAENANIATMLAEERNGEI